MRPDEITPGDLCTECGICCSDAMFALIRLREGDAERLLEHGYPAERLHEGFLTLPCPFLSAAKCSIYPDRPKQCAEYRCEVLKGAQAGSMPLADARERVRTARSLLARLREVMPEGVSMDAARARWGEAGTGGRAVEPAEAAAQLAFYAYYKYMDRHFRPPRKWMVTAAPDDMRPETQAPPAGGTG